tara:strand:- start:333 stop:1073 length:741 start_codon:yes stop_codon:yes gene_type:complete
MILSVNQPTFLPWIGQFALIDQVDVFVFYDDVQLVKQSWDVRNRIKTQQGPIWLTLPIKHNKNFKELKFNVTEINNDLNWKKKHFKTLQNSYRKSKNYFEVIDWFENVIFNNFNFVSEMNIYLIKQICSKIGIETKFINSSDLKSSEGKKDIRLVKICKELNVKAYLSPIGSSAYIELNSPGGEFTKNDIKLNYQNYKHPIYSQLYGDFISHMSIVDLLFNVGFNDSLSIIRSGIGNSFNSIQLNK